MIAHSPDGNSASARRVAPAVLEAAFLLHVHQGLHVPTCSGLLIFSSASIPSRPLALVASGTLWMALNFSNCAQVGHAMVKPQGAALAARIFLAAARRSRPRSGAACSDRAPPS